MYFFNLFEINLIYLAAFAVSLALGFAFSFIYKCKLYPALSRIFAKTRHEYDSILLSGFKMPIVVFFAICGIYISLLFLPRALGILATPIYLAAIAKLMRIGIILLIVWGLVGSSDVASVFLQGMQNKLDIKSNQTMARFLGYIFKTIVLALGAVIIISELGYDVNGLIAGLGLGGLTIALAAKDTAGNFFGGVIIIFEKPFEIGDWISALDYEGIVEDITFRSTKLRTFSNALTIIPNSTLSSGAITNWTRMKMRKVSLNLALPGETDAAQMDLFLSSVRKELLANTEIVPDTVQVRFSDFGRGVLNVTVVYFTQTTVFSDYLDIKEHINMRILNLLSANNIKLAAPLDTIHQ
ncbi:MAG: mechanosensitive ion channel family protein [Oscillospiraceae bacterium]